VALRPAIYRRDDDVVELRAVKRSAPLRLSPEIVARLKYSSKSQHLSLAPWPILQAQQVDHALVDGQY
jgi:hypothetical protein